MDREAVSKAEINNQKPEGADQSDTLLQLAERAVYELPNIEAVFLFDSQGTLMASAGREAAEVTHALALSVGLIQLAERASSDLGRGMLQHAALQGQTGYFIARQLGGGFVLMILGREKAPLGVLIHDMDWLSTKLLPTG